MKFNFNRRDSIVMDNVLLMPTKLMFSEQTFVWPCRLNQAVTGPRRAHESRYLIRTVYWWKWRRSRIVKWQPAAWASRKEYVTPFLGCSRARLSRYLLSTTVDITDRFWYALSGLVHTFRFSTGRQVPIFAGQSSGTQESKGVFTQSGRLAGRENTWVCDRVYEQHVHHCWLNYRPATGHSSG
jgi:hypothetical protein